MISNPNIAREVSDLMRDVFHRIDESCQMVRSKCPPDEANAYLKSVGKVAGAIVLDVLEPLYKRNPSLKPDNWNR
jgi:hypothetical protein